MRIFRSNKGVSLIEVLIAIGIFAVVAIIASGILISVVKMEKRTSIQSALYQDMRLILQELTKEIQNGTIDYEEYYNYFVIQDGDDPKYFGTNYGVYGSRFFDPGSRADGADSFNPDDLGIECSYVDAESGNCEVSYSLSLDLSTGQNPFTGNSGTANAFCDQGIGYGEGPCGVMTPFVIVDNLFLIDNTGTKKTIIGKKRSFQTRPGDEDYVVGLVRMEGEDVDQNGLIDTFSCAEEFNCEADLAAIITPDWLEAMGYDTFNQFFLETGITLPISSDLDTAFNFENSYFVPISPMRSDVKDLRFIITPIEDPYKAYAEDNVQIHPSITILLTLGLSDAVESDYPGDFPDLTIQTTVSAGVLARIDSYPPINEVIDGMSWIDSVLPDALDVP